MDLSPRCLPLVAVCLLGASFWMNAPAAAVQSAQQSVLIRGVPHVRQKPDFCGEACAEMYLTKLGKQMDQDFVFDLGGVDPVEGRGCYTRELARSLQRIGFRTGPIWYEVSPRAADRQLAALFRAVHADLVAGVPSILCMHYDDSPQTTEHFRLILGYDAASDEVIYHEPAVRRGEYLRMKRELLLRLWPLKYDPQRWTVIWIRLEAGQLSNARSSTQLTDADYAQHIMQLREQLGELRARQLKLQKQRQAEIDAELAKEKKLKAEGKEYEPVELEPRIVSDFQIVLQKPFVVVGDEPLETVQAHARGTIQWAVSRLKQSYFSQDPDQVLNIWLFRNEQSYEQNVRDLFGSWPHTPFGYYSYRERALVMNIDTGGGTLVHELVHAFMESNFPECPAWFNEGLGALYEQCEDRHGQIWGLTNWRLNGLQEALKDEEYELPTFETLCGTTSREFYDEDPGTNYAQARYLCYYLQEAGLLLTFFDQFRRDVQADPSGYQNLQNVLDEEDMEQFQARWVEWVKELRR